MSLRDELQASLQELISDTSETITLMGGKPIPALITRPSLESGFVPGLELQDVTIQARVAKDCLPEDPDLQTIWVIRGREMRLIKVESHPHSLLLQFGDPEN